MIKRVLTVGVYDFIHIGHVNLFCRAKGLGDLLIVAVQESDYVSKFKPSANLVYSTEERMYMAKAIRFVDGVVSYTTVDTIVKEVAFDILVAGPDQTHQGFQEAFEWCRKNGKQIVILPRTEGISSSWLKDQIEKM